MLAIFYKEVHKTTNLADIMTMCEQPFIGSG